MVWILRSANISDDENELMHTLVYIILEWMIIQASSGWILEGNIKYGRDAFNWTNDCWFVPIDLISWLKYNLHAIKILHDLLNRLQISVDDWLDVIVGYYLQQ